MFDIKLIYLPLRTKLLHHKDYFQEFVYTLLHKTQTLTSCKGCVSERAIVKKATIKQKGITTLRTYHY